MLRQSLQALDILLDQLRRSVVVVQNGKYTVNDSMIPLPNPYVYGKDCMYYNK